ncbi:MAG TPA: MBL fold metallo-hydrolase [Candidatus Acidoferrum sp.]|nr:MBL fold metallo-hydrolase [Candidatus Acidoferrum sp.]
MIQPVLKDDDFLADVLAARDYTDEVHIWWLGQSGFLVQWQNHHLLLDPYLSDSLTHKYAATDKPHVRMTERVVQPERLNFIDVVTSSHNHTDHLDKETLVALMRVNPRLQLVVPEANRGFVADRLDIMIETPRGMDAGEIKQFGVFEIEAVPAAHPGLEHDEWGRHKFLGYVVKCGNVKIYHSGDTLRYEGIEATLSCCQPDVALLPINGDKPERRVAGNLNAHEAATLAKSIGARVAIPCHYDMFEFNTESPDEFIAACATVGQPYRILRAGERWSSSELDAVVR